MLVDIKFNIAIYTLKAWEKVYKTYSFFKNNKVYGYALIGVILAVVVALLYANRGSGSFYNSLGYDPYEVFGSFSKLLFFIIHTTNNHTI
jgi:hypothetical protein